MDHSKDAAVLDLTSTGESAAAAPPVRELADRRKVFGDQVDLLFRKAASGAVAFWFMNGTAVVSASISGNIARDWEIQGTGDFNGDGMSDILWRNENPAAPDAGALYMWIMDGPRVVVRGYVSYGMNLDWTVQALGDLDGDKRTDILWRATRGPSEGTLTVWRMWGMSVFEPPSLGPVGPRWIVQGLGDSFFANTRLTSDEHRGVASGQARQHAGDLANRRRSTEDAFDQTLARGNDPMDTFNQRIEIERFGNEVISPLLEQIDRRIDIAVPGNEDEGRDADVFGQQLHEQLVTA